MEFFRDSEKSSFPSGRDVASVLAGLCREGCAGGAALLGTAGHGGAVTVLVPVCHVWWLREPMCDGGASSGSRHIVSWGVSGGTSCVAPLSLLERRTSNVRAHLIRRRGREELALLLALNIQAKPVMLGNY